MATGKRSLQYGDFLVRLQEQLTFLIASASSFDHGVTIEARRLATVVSTLLIDTKRGRSLVTHLGWTELRLVDSGTLQRRFLEVVKADIRNGGGNPDNLVSMGSPLTYYTNSPAGQLPHFDEGLAHADWLSRKEWLEQTAVYSGNTPITRNALIGFLRNKDGGAHIDGQVEEGIHGVVRERAADLRVLVDDTRLTVTNTAEAAMRQIATEVVVSIREYLH